MKKNYIFKTSRREMLLGEHTLVMGIINVTPDSFSDGGQFTNSDQAVEEGIRMVEAGADILDVGGESTRPGADAVSPEEELARIIPVIGGLAGRVHVPVSVDTMKAAVALEAVDCGAEIINDVSALRFDNRMAEVVRKTGAGVILMHMRGMPKTMQSGSLVYESLIDEIIFFLRERLNDARSRGVELERMMIDPGIGFGKTAEDNMKILHNLARFGELGLPILTGVSRKSFIGKVLGGEPHSRIEGTAAAVTVSIMNGSSVVRVHDVGAMKKVAAMADAILNS